VFALVPAVVEPAAGVVDIAPEDAGGDMPGGRELDGLLFAPLFWVPASLGPPPLLLPLAAPFASEPAPAFPCMPSPGGESGRHAVLASASMRFTPALLLESNAQAVSSTNHAQ
jgi:hypothetical protein